jgi:hypothetical protein
MFAFQISFVSFYEYILKMVITMKWFNKNTLVVKFRKLPTMLQYSNMKALGTVLINWCCLSIGSCSRISGALCLDANPRPSLNISLNKSCSKMRKFNTSYLISHCGLFVNLNSILGVICMTIIDVLSLIPLSQTNISVAARSYSSRAIQLPLALCSPNHLAKF